MKKSAVLKQVETNLKNYEDYLKSLKLKKSNSKKK